MGTESCWELSYYFFDWRISKENLQTRDFRTSYPATILKTQVGEGMKWCDRLCRAQFGIAISLLLWHLRFRNHGLFTFIRFILELKPRNTDKLGILNSIIARTREVRAHWTAESNNLLRKCRGMKRTHGDLPVPIPVPRNPRDTNKDIAPGSNPIAAIEKLGTWIPIPVPSKSRVTNEGSASESNQSATMEELTWIPIPVPRKPRDRNEDLAPESNHSARIGKP